MAPVLSNLLWALFGWIFLWPLTFLVPRVTSSVVVIGRDGGKFLDNAKHFFIGLHQTKNHAGRVTFLTDQKPLRLALAMASLRVGTLSGPKGWWQLLRCATAVVDSVGWMHGGRFAALRGARVVQLWHGVPLKRIELLLAEEIAAGLSELRRAAFWSYRAITARHHQVDCLVSTSCYVCHAAMKQCFHAKRWPVTGYPRNDVLLDDELRLLPLMWIGSDPNARKAVQDAKSRGLKVVLYAPTFRRDFRDPFATGIVDLAALDDFGLATQMLLLIKLHPLMQQPREAAKRCQSVVFVSPDSDIYPLLPEVDGLVTDYSSIYFDFLLLDRPVVFFCHDLDKYRAEDRGFIFNYDEMTPGPKVRYQAELQTELLAALRGDDSWRVERSRVRELAFDHVEGSAVRRLMAYLEERP